MGKFLLCLALSLSKPALGYQGGALVNHGHTSSAGDGGPLSSPVITGTIAPATMTVTGTLTVGGNTYSSGTASVAGLLTVSSVSVTGKIQGGLVVDSITVNGSVTTFGNILNSSQTAAALPSQTWTQTVGGGCVVGSTLTITLGVGSRIAGNFTGSGDNNGLGQNNFLGYVLDGAFEAPYASNIPLTSQAEDVASDFFTANFQFITRVLSSGSHTLCISAWVTGGTLTFPHNATGKSVARFTLWEMK